MNTTTTGAVVAGIDFSSESRVAAEFAAAEAKRRGTALKLIYGMPVAAPYLPGALAVQEHDSLYKSADRELTAVRDELQGHHPDLEITAAVSALSGLPALIVESEGASVIVVGRRGLGGVERLLLGSVASQLPLHAHCPVIVTSDAGDRPGPVMACVDGTDTAPSVVRFAAGAASATGSDLVVVHVWALPEPMGLKNELGWSTDRDEADHQLHDAAARTVAEAVAGVQEDFPGLRIERRLVHSLAIGQALLDEAETLDASLVVTASRGHSELVHLFLGSVSRVLLIRSGRAVAVLTR